MLFTTTIVSALLSLGVAAVPAAQDVWVPRITSPSAGTIWTAGQTVNVTWDASNPPSQVTNPNGRLVLARGGIQDWQNPLAEGFPVADGWVSCVVPDVETDFNYAVVLFGDSGNYSPEFTIFGH